MAEKYIEIKYGSGEISIKSNKNMRILENNRESSMPDLHKIAKKRFENPICSPTLSRIVHEENPKNIVIIINDITRPTPYDLLLEPMLKELEAAGVKKRNITILIATGMHRPMADGEITDMLGSKIAGEYKIVNHLAGGRMTYIGHLAYGIPISINPLVAKADLLLSVGVIAPHYMAGYSGGRKSVLPGVCGIETIKKHHALMCLKGSRTLNIEGNPFNETMVEAASYAKLRFIANAVADSGGNIADIVTGHYLYAWREGVKICETLSTVEIDRLGDLAVVSPGGYPKDINMYQAQKAIENASYCLKAGAPIILIAECREGFGNKTFKEWIDDAKCPEDIADRIKKEFQLGGHKAYSIARVIMEHPIYLMSGLSHDSTNKLFMEKFHDVDKLLYELVDDQSIVYVLPHGSNTVPKMTNLK
ncbi:MAG TPA: nickel-dependent lactate racemase [Clostridiaceae bacterium]|nr:nickel-dependent lactate racemase [Clostridiaceae bacterium]